MIFPSVMRGGVLVSEGEAKQTCSIVYSKGCGHTILKQRASYYFNAKVMFSLYQRCSL
jgi:hypothetical protein